MIKFFRKIRYDLIEKNKTGKYLKYAIGEIVLVVVGILIALQINTWNENQKLRIQELIHLRNLKDDLLEDKESLSKINERRIDKANSADIMNNYYKEKPIDNLKDYYFHLANTLSWETHQPKNITFLELVNSGKLSIISNSEIKKLLLEISTSYEEMFAVRTHMYHDYTDYFYKNYAENIDFESSLLIWADPSIKIELSQEDITEALENRAIKNGFVLASYNNKLLSKQSSNILAKVDMTIQLIEDEIERE